MIAIEMALVANEEVRGLIGELEEALSAEYSPEQRHGLRLDAIFQSHIRFFVARLDGAAVGCGGVALFDGFAEVKRMYVREAARGRGVAGAVLARLEAEAQAAGIAVLRLETGDRQLAAMRFYERCAFRRCGGFGDYAVMPPAAIAASVFYQKRFTSNRGASRAHSPG